MRPIIVILLLLTCTYCGNTSNNRPVTTPITNPNFLVIMTDDQSWAHTGIAGYPLVSTPNFDAIAQQGLYFEHGFAPTPTCTATRSAVISGQDFWRTGSGAVLMGTYPKSLISYQEILKDHGYKTGYTGKAWGPGSHSQKPLLLGPIYKSQVRSNPPDGISTNDYSGNLDKFLQAVPKKQAFSFWIGISEPHRSLTRYHPDGYAEQDGSRFNTAEKQKYLPAFLPNTAFAQKDFAGYLAEIEEFDRELARILATLEKHQQLENTLIVITSDNGMPYVGAKATNSYYGVKVPFAVMWGRTKTRLARTGIEKQYMVNGIDIAPTFLDAAGIPIPKEMTGISFLPLLKRGTQPESSRNDYVVTGFERHNPTARENHGTYPSRALITKQYMYIYNALPQRWPYGDPPQYGDGPVHILRRNVDQRESKKMENWLLNRRPAEMLFDITKDPYQQNNLIADPGDLNKYANILDYARKHLSEYQKNTGDPILQNPDYFSSMPYNR